MNFLRTQITGGNYADDATSITVADGSRIEEEFHYVVWNKTYDSPTDAYEDGALEIVKVTGVATNTLTIVRAREGTSAIAITSDDVQWELYFGITEAYLLSNLTLLDAKTTLAGTEEVLINDGGTLKKTTIDDIADYINS